ncbi:MAG: spore cortex biosynthesis protein YabQ [Ruminococcus sp.]
MELYQTFHPTVFLISLLWGVLIFVLYDINRFLRYIFSNHKYVIILLDILFMILCAVIVFLFSLAYNFGKPRIYMLIGMALSTLALRFTLGKLSLVIFVKLFSIFSVIIQKIYLFFKKLLTKLLKSFASLVYNLGVIIKRIIFFKKGCKNEKTKQYKC